MRVLMLKAQDFDHPPLFYTGIGATVDIEAWTNDLDKAWRVPEDSVDTLIHVSRTKSDCVWEVVDLVEKILTDDRFLQWWGKRCAVGRESEDHQ